MSCSNDKCTCHPCSCGGNCTCGRSSTEQTTTETLVMGVAPVRAQFEGAEMGVAAENGGCGCKCCGSECKCPPPCNCN